MKACLQLQQLFCSRETNLFQDLINRMRNLNQIIVFFFYIIYNHKLIFLQTLNLNRLKQILMS